MTKFARAWQYVWAVSAALAATVPALAAVTPAEAARLKGDLTPVGAEKAGNADGSIPPWTGGFSSKTPAVSGKRSDPFASEKPLISINAENASKYSDKLSPGVLAMLKRFPKTFRVDVYPTHRTAAMPQSFYDASEKNATQAKLTIAGDGRPQIEGDAGGVPFPIPKTGAEAMMNGMTFFIPSAQFINANNYLIQADGRRVLVSVYSNSLARYYTQEERTGRGLYQAVRSQTTNPPIRSGEGIVGNYFTDTNKDQAWVYLPGQRRTRKLPNSCCDTPTPFSSGLIGFDEIGGGFFGSIHKFDWTLVGKKEMYIPYNGNRVVLQTKPDELFKQYHLNPDLVRWELHRVWVVEGKLRQGERHTSPRTVVYLDEDWWGPTLSDRYDAQGQLARTGFDIPVLLTESGSLYNLVWGVYDLLSGSAYISNLFDETTQLKVMDSIPASTLSPEALAGDSAR